MKCVIITKTNPNENIPGYWSLLECGLDLNIIRHPVVFYNESMPNILISPTPNGSICQHSKRLRPAVTSLLYTWIDMLETYKDDPDEFILFGESDIMTQYYLSQDVLINSFTKKYDIIRPYTGITRQEATYNLINKNYAYCKWFHNLEFHPVNSFKKDFGPNVLQPPFYGTHALIISKQGRRKLLNVFKTFIAPVDISLCWGVYANKLTMCSASKQLFIQNSRPTTLERPFI